MIHLQKKIWLVLLIGCFLTLFSPMICHAQKITKTVPPALSANTDEYGIIHVDTQAPQYMIEWDTTRSFQHKKVYPLYRGTDYYADIYTGTVTKVNLYFPDPAKTYYVRAYNIYPRQTGFPRVSKVSEILKIAPRSTPAAKAPVIKKLARPKVKTSLNRSDACIDLELTLPANATGYMVECSRLKSFPYTRLHPLYWDSENYYIRYNNTVKDRKQFLQIAFSELSGNYTYIRVYAVSDQPADNRSYISMPTGVKKVSWK